MRNVDPVNNRIEINYRDLANWFMSNSFSSLILSGRNYGVGHARRVAYDTWKAIDGSGNDNDRRVRSRGPRFPDDNHVVGGLHLGSEIWGNNNNREATVTFNKIGFEVGGRKFGIFD